MPVYGIPYWQVLINITAMETNEADMKSDSTWSVKEFTKLPGLRWNLVQIRIQFIAKRTMLRKKKKRPMPRSQDASHFNE